MNWFWEIVISVWYLETKRGRGSEGGGGGGGAKGAHPEGEEQVRRALLWLPLCAFTCRSCCARRICEEKPWRWTSASNTRCSSSTSCSGWVQNTEPAGPGPSSPVWVGSGSLTLTQQGQNKNRLMFFPLSLIWWVVLCGASADLHQTELRSGSGRGRCPGSPYAPITGPGCFMWII